MLTNLFRPGRSAAGDVDLSAQLAAPVSTLEPRAVHGHASAHSGGLIAPAGAPAPARIGSLRSPASTIAGVAGTPATPAAPTAPAAPAAQRGAASLEARVGTMEALLSQIAAKMGVTGTSEMTDPGDEEDETEGAAEGDTPEGEDEDAAEGSAKANPAKAGSATAAQIRAACQGADAEFVLSCVEQGLTAKQAKGMFEAQRARVPQRRNRSPLPAGAGRSQGAGDDSRLAQIESQITARAQEIVREKRCSMAVAQGLAMNELKPLDPEGVRAYVLAKHSAIARENIGAASA